MFKGKKFLSVVLAVLFCVPVKAETVIEIKIPDEVKKPTYICNCPICAAKRIGDFEDHTADPQSLPLQTEEIEPDNIMLQKIAIAEAGTDTALMMYVIQTVLNRVNSSEFPNTVFEVISQKGQFSTYPKKYNKAVPDALSKKALDLVDGAINQDQLYFENTTIGSWQNTHLTPVFEYSGLTFYK